MVLRTILLAAAVATAACSREDATKPAARVQAPASPATVADAPAKDGDIQALEERLARQESAARMFERKVLEPAPPPRLAIPTPAAPQAPEPAPPNNLSAPEKAAPSSPSPPPKAAAAATPAKIEPPPRIDTAAARPAAPRLVTRVDPEYPREALRARVDQGEVRARLVIDANGAVSRVEILEARPRRVFDRAVTQALSQWKFDAGAEGRTTETEISFRR